MTNPNSSFVFSTDVSQDYEPVKGNEFPENDAYVLLYTIDGQVCYDVGTNEEDDRDLIMLLSSLSNPVVVHDLLGCLPDMLEYGEEIADEVADILDMQENTREAYSNVPLVQPANMFRQNSHDHDHN